jgi:hypothetical protein
VSDRDRSRRLLIKRTLYASGALFASLFVLLSAQMVLGRDPALGSRAPKAPVQTAQVRRGGEHEQSIVDRLLSLAGSALSGGDHGGAAPSGQSQSSQSTPAPAPVPAPVQSATS